MDPSRQVPAVGAVAALVLAVVVAVPFVVVEGVGRTLSDYYAAGVAGVGGVAFLALLSVVAFAAGRDGATPAPTAAGIAAVLGVAELLLAASWALSIDRTLLFSFPAQYAWIEYHRVAVVGLALAAAGAGLWYATVATDADVVDGDEGIGGD